jgi:hypothetical protein
LASAWSAARGAAARIAATPRAIVVPVELELEGRRASGDRGGGGGGIVDHHRGRERRRRTRRARELLDGVAGARAGERGARLVEPRG